MGKRLQRGLDRFGPVSRTMVAVIGGLALFNGAALAQDQAASSPAADTQEGLSDIVVTAQFRESNVQDTPLAITAVNAELLEARGQSSLYEVAAQAPSVVLKPAGDSLGPSMIAYIRGIGQQDFNFAVEPGVGVYVDDVYYSTLTGSLLELMDLERVEVLRGPQGTLAGRNSIGGAIKLYSRAPDGKNGGSAQVTIGSYNRIDARAVGDFTIIPDRLAARVAGALRQRDGYIDRLDYGCTHPRSGASVLTGANGCKIGEQGDQSYGAGRVSLRWTPSTDVTVDLAGDIVNDNSGAAASTLLYGNVPGPGPSIDDGNPATPPLLFQNNIFVPYGKYRNPGDPVNDPYVNYATFSDNSQPTANEPWKPVSFSPKNSLDSWGVSGRLNWKINEDLTLTSITAYREYTAEFTSDFDQSPVSNTLVSNKLTHWQFSQELRLNGTSLNKLLDWTVGAFYFKQDGAYAARVDLTYLPLDFYQRDTTPAKTWAVFAHTGWHIGENTDLIAGIRYTDDRKNYTYERKNPDGTIPGPFPAPNFQVGPINGLTGAFKGNRTDWRLALNHHFADKVMGYAQVSTGFKGGGVNPRPFFAEQLKPFDPETMTTYEVGLKSTFWDRRIRLNAAAFYNDYKNIQLTLNTCERPSPPFPTPVGTPCRAPRNVGTAKVKGAELEMEFLPTPYLSFNGSLSYLDFKYTRLRSGALAGSSSPIAPLDMVTPYTPKWSWSLGGQYEIPLKTGSIRARLDANYQGDVYTDAINNTSNLIKGYTVLNGRISWTSEDSTWQVALEVQNLTNKLYYLTLFDQLDQAGTVVAQPAMPRTWAVSVKRNF